MSNNIVQILDESLREKYVGLCLSLGHDNEIKDIPEIGEGLVERIKALTFEWMHRYHIQ